MKYKNRAFTLIELLIVIAVIAILAAVAFVALDPLTRFQDSRDSTRWGDVTAILDAVKIDQVDNGGSYVAAVSSLTADTDYMIGTCTTTCDATPCDVTIVSTNGVDLAALVTEGYLASVPISSDGAGTWTAVETGYYLNRSAAGTLTVGSCESENTGSINVAR